MIVNSIESDWPQLIGENEYESFQELTLGTGLKTKEKINILLGIYTPRQLIFDKERRPILLSRLRLEDAKDLASLLNIKYTVEEEMYTKLTSSGLSSSKLELVCSFFDIEPLPAENNFTEYDCPLCKSHIITEKEKLESIIDIEPVYAMHPYQIEVERLVDKFLPPGEFLPRCLINMPTGSGKTRTTMDYLCRKIAESDCISVIWLAHNYELCEQASYEFQRAWKYKGNRKVKVINFFGNTDVEFPKESFDGILISTLGKIASVMKSNRSALSKLASKISYVVFDEAHQIIAPVYKTIVDSFIEINDYCALIGLTATPGRKWNEMDEDIRLANYFRNHIAPIVIPDGRSVTQFLTDEGYLSKPINHLIDYTSPYISQESKQLMKKISNNVTDNIDIDPMLSFKIGQDSTRNIKIVEQMSKFVEEYGLKRIIVFASDLHHSRVLTALFKYCGWNAFCIDSKTDMGVRHKIIDDFKKKNDQPMIICNYDILTTGFDVPIIDGGIIARPTMSLVLYSQMVGRIIRGPRAGGTEYAHIATVKDVALWRGFEDSYGYWNDVWYNE